MVSNIGYGNIHEQLFGIDTGSFSLYDQSVIEKKITINSTKIT